MEYRDIRVKAPGPNLRLLAFVWVIALAVQAAVLPMTTSDLVAYNIPWFDHIVQTGPIQAFAHPFGNYSPPYAYLLAAITPLHEVMSPTLAIKLLSLGCTALLTASVWRLLRALDVAHAGRWALVVPLLPSIMFSGAILGQSDTLYAAPCVMAVAAAIEGRHRAMLAWCGLAFAIKAQALFGAPFVLAIIIARRVPVRHWLIAPAAFAAALAPAALAGWPIIDLLMIYPSQTTTFDAIALCAPNVWMLVQLAGVTLPLVGLALAMAVGGAAAYVARIGASARTFSGPMLLRASLLAPLLLAGLLPRMHERYFFLADVLSLALAIAAPSRDTLRIQAWVQLGSILALVGYLLKFPALAGLGALPMVAATWLVARPFLVSPANDNGLPLNPFRTYPA